MNKSLLAQCDLTPTVRDAVLRLDPHAFATRTFEILHAGRQIERNWHIEAINKALDDVLEGKTTRLIINAPPRSLKSFLASVAFTAFALGRDPSCKLICISYGQDLASKLASDARRLMESKLYCRLFPNISFSKSTENELQTDEGGFRYATSVGGTLTGRGGDILIVDDPLNASEASSESVRQRTNEWFSKTLASRLDNRNTGAIIVIMQRLHQEDLTGYLLDRGGWELLCLPAVAPRDSGIPIWNGTYPWLAGHPLQPIRFEDLDGTKATLGPEAFNAQYLQAPVPAEGNMLKREWLREYAITPLVEKKDQIVQSWDTALTANKTSDYSVCLIFRVRNQNEYYLIGVFRQKLKFPELVDNVMRLASIHNPHAILIENKGSGISLIQTVRNRGFQGVNQIDPESDKKTRMYGQTAKLSAGSLILPKAAPWLGDFMLEYLAFPGGRYNDQIDALSQFLNWQSDRERTPRLVVDWGYGPLKTY